MSESHHSVVAHPVFHWLQIVLIAVASGWAIWALLQGNVTSAAAFAAVAALGMVLFATPERLPSAFRLLFTGAMFINAVGYAMNLWNEATVFDEAVHAFTSFAASAAVAWLALGRTDLVEARNAMRLVVAAAAIGIGLGVAWEGVEWLLGIIGGWTDTLMDLAMDLAGAVAAGLFCAWAASLKRARAF